MQVEEFIEYTESRLKTANLVLSEFGKSEISKRWKQKPDQGGYSNYWKETDLEDVQKLIKS